MHEKKVMEHLLHKILSLASEQNATLITKVSVKLGALCHMDAAHFKEHFDEVAKGTIAERALIDAELSFDLLDPGAQSVTLKSIDIS